MTRKSSNDKIHTTQNADARANQTPRFSQNPASLICCFCVIVPPWRAGAGSGPCIIFILDQPNSSTVQLGVVKLLDRSPQIITTTEVSNSGGEWRVIDASYNKPLLQAVIGLEPADYNCQRHMVNR